MPLSRLADRSSKWDSRHWQQTHPHSSGFDAWLVALSVSAKKASSGWCANVKANMIRPTVHTASGVSRCQYMSPAHVNHIEGDCCGMPAEEICMALN